jgi:hypothetical protein
MTRILPRSNGRRSAGSSTKAPTPWVTGTAVSSFIAATTSISMAHPAACRRSWRTCRRSEISSGGVARRLVINIRQLHFRQQRASLDRDGWRLEIGPGRRCLGHRCRRQRPYADEAFICRAAGRGIMRPLLHAGRQNVLRRSSAPGRREKNQPSRTRQRGGRISRTTCLHGHRSLLSTRTTTALSAVRRKASDSYSAQRAGRRSSRARMPSAESSVRIISITRSSSAL